MRRLVRSARIFGAAGAASAATEFAVVLPVLIVLLLAGFQLVLYINATRKVENVVYSVSQMISQATPPIGSTTATVSATDIRFSFDAALVLFPYLMSDAKQKGITWSQDITINAASIQFTQISTACAGKADQSACYTARVVWTTPGGANARPCLSTQGAADDTASPTNTTLPRSLYGPGSVIAVDVIFAFVPNIGARFLPTLTIRRSAFIQPRYAALITYDPTNDTGIAKTCSLS